jgi:hypothetical protein
VFSLFVFLALLVGIAYLARKAWRAVPPAGRAEIDRLWRAGRVRLGQYGLELLMRRMRDEMLGSVVPSITQSYVPNVMRFGLHPQDARRWGQYFDQLAKELHTLMLREVDARGLKLNAAGLRVLLFEDETAEPGRPTFSASMAKPGKDRQPTPRRLVTTQPFSPFGDDDATELAPAGDEWTLVFEDGATHALVGETLVGRGPDADIRVGTDDISRAHARLVLADGGVTIIDLASNNGTFVNGSAVGTATLEPGDIVRFGRATTATVRNVPVTRGGRAPV